MRAHRRPVVGITSDYSPGRRGGEPTFFLRARYVAALRDLGALPVILPCLPDEIDGLLARIDGLVLTGSGPDLDPRLYGEEKRYRFKLMSPERADFEMRLVRRAMERATPVLGICGGMQVINVALGGTLHQDIAQDIPGSLPHRQQEPAVRATHEVAVAPNTRLAGIVREPVIRVNSSHHQCVKSIAPGLVVNATAPDGVIEGLEHSGPGFTLGVQWHPEFLYGGDVYSRRLFEALIDAVRGHPS